jgi:hypothetical protein
MPSGSLRLDVRLTIETDDGALIYMTYGGVVVGSKEAGETLLNQVQAIEIMAKYKRTKNDAYVNYDVFITR